MSILAPINTPNNQLVVFRETASGPGTIQNGFQACGFLNTGNAPVIIDGQSIPAGVASGLPFNNGEQYHKDITYDATGSTLLITAIY